MRIISCCLSPSLKRFLVDTTVFALRWRSTPRMSACTRDRSCSTERERPRKVARLEIDAERVQDIMSAPIDVVPKHPCKLDYTEKLVLAPMVRTGTLPTRLLSLFYGAGLVWSPEIVDKAIIGATRTVDEQTGVITYHKGQGPIFSTHPIEKPYLIFQIGSSDPELAVKAAQTVAADVSGIDLNCGCPKPFSTHAGMGAALLSTPDTLLDILRSLLSAIALPISCKIRLLPEQPATLELVARILRTGISNLTVHCRTRNMRSGERALWERLSDIVDLGKARGVPVICNGDSNGWENWERIRSETGATSVMIARAAERNPSVFAPSGPSCNVTTVIPQLLSIAEYTSNPWGNTKFLLSQFKPSPPPISSMTKAKRKEVQEVISRSKSLDEIMTKLGVEQGRGAGFFKDLNARLESRHGDVWTERQAAEDAGTTVDEPVEGQADGEQPAACHDGFEVGVGLASLPKSVETSNI